MKKLIIFGVFLLLSCSKNEQQVKDTSKEPFVQEKTTISLSSIPFTRVEELNTFSEYPEIVDYQLARKLAFIELKETGFAEEMGWGSFTLSSTPIVIYNLKSIPRYYDYIVIDPEEKPIGTLRVNANRENSTLIKAVCSSITDYNRLLSKSLERTPSLFENWLGAQYVGLKGAIGEPPSQLIENNSGLSVSSDEIKELEGEEIIEYLLQNVYSQILPIEEKAFETLPNHFFEIDSVKAEIDYSKKITIEQVRDSMQSNLNDIRKNAKNFWYEIENNKEVFSQMTDEELVTGGTKFWGRIIRVFRRIFSFRTDRNSTVIEKYERNIYNYPRRGWCGPWVCGYIVYANQKIDKYSFFENCASTFGEFGEANVLLRFLGRPMTPAEMSWSMPIASLGRIRIEPSLYHRDMYAYDQIKNNKRPVILLCGVVDQKKRWNAHWTLAYGAKQTGSYLWRNYYFLQIDNGAKIKTIGDSEKNYHQVDWWNAWLMVWD